MASVPVALGFALTTLVVGAGCQPPTEVTVALSTNLPCDEIDGTGLVIGSPEDVDTKDVLTVTPTCDGGRIGTLVVIPGEDREAVFAVKAVTGVGVLPEECLTGAARPTDVPGERGCIVARRELGFVPKTPLTLPMVMRRDCIAVSCDAGTTCVEGGVCVSARVVDPLRCSEPGGCDETSLGPVTSSDQDGGAGGGGP